MKGAIDAVQLVIDPAVLDAAAKSVRPPRPLLEGERPTDDVERFLIEHDLVLGRTADRVHVQCPWDSGHSTGTPGDTSSSWLRAGSGNFEVGHFSCRHDSCSGRSDGDFLDAIGWTLDGFEVIDISTADDPPASQSRRAVYQLLTIDDLAARPPISWRIKHVLPERGLASIYGPSGAGKGFVVIDMAMAISCGLPWFGHRVKPGSVVYCALEGEEGIPQRVAAYRARRTGVGEQMRFLLQPFNLLSHDVEALAKAIADTGCRGGITILDTLNRAAPGIDENDSKDMGRIIDSARALQGLVGGLVILVHHTGKDPTKGLRGHSSLHAALDCAIEVRRAGDLHDWSIVKSKDGRDGNFHLFHLDVVELGKDEDGDPITSCVVEPAVDTRSQMRKIKIPHGGNQKIILKAIRELLLNDSPLDDKDWPKSAPVGRPCVKLEDVVIKTRDRLTCAEDQRTRSTRTAITGLVNAGLLELNEGWLWEP